MKKARLIAALLSVALLIGTISGCGATSSSASTSTSPSASATTESDSPTQTVVIKGIADLTPHSELIEYVKPILAAQGIDVELVATSADSTTNEKLETGEIDFNYFQHQPYLDEWNAANGGDLVSAGSIHVEPITAYSDKYTSTDQIPDNAVVAIPNDATNEYRALSILEENGFIKLNPDASSTLSASVKDIQQYIRPLKIVELDSAQIIPTKSDYDFFITNTNKALEAKLTSNKLFSESGDSPYANIIAVRPEDKDNPAIVALVKALQSDDTRAYIESKYNGAVIPAKLS